MSNTVSYICIISDSIDVDQHTTCLVCRNGYSDDPVISVFDVNGRC